MNHIDGRIEIGKGTIIEDTAIIMGDVTIGRDCYIGHYAILGAPPQYKGYYPYPIDGNVDTRGVFIESRVVIREYTQVHAGIQHDTMIGHDTLIMAGCHIAHDTKISEHCTIGSFTTFGGHTSVCPDVTFGQGCVTHPWVVIGEHAMIGLNSSVTRDVLPYQKVAGSPARLIGKNTGAGGEKEQWSEDVLDLYVWDEYSRWTQTRDLNRQLLKETEK